MADWLLYEHTDGRHAVAPNAEAATFAHGDPKWNRVGPVAVAHAPGLATLENVVQCLRSEARYVDEEGEETNKLEDLLHALRGTSGVSPSDISVPPAIQEGGTT